jgi:hypothetical protein
MAKHFVTFGQDHVHALNGKTLDKDCVASFEAKDWKEGRERAFELFGPKFCFEYHDREFTEDILKYFPRGIIDID